MACSAGDAVVVTEPVAHRIGQPRPFRLPNFGVVVIQGELTQQVANAVDDMSVGRGDQSLRDMTVGAAGTDPTCRRLMGGCLIDLGLGKPAGRRSAGRGPSAAIGL